MSIKVLALLCLGLVPVGVSAQTQPGPQPGPFTSPTQEPYRGPAPARPAPNRPADPARDAAERATADEVRLWGERIERLAGRPQVEADDLRNLRRQHQQLVLQQGQLVQAQGAAWDDARKQFEQASSRLASDFERAGGQLAETR